MKCRVYLRVAQDDNRRGEHPPYRLKATESPKYEPLADGSARPLPTAAFALDLDIPDAVFRHAERVLAELVVPEDRATAAVEIAVAP